MAWLTIAPASPDVEHLELRAVLGLEGLDDRLGQGERVVGHERDDGRWAAAGTAASRSPLARVRAAMGRMRTSLQCPSGGRVPAPDRSDGALV